MKRIAAGLTALVLVLTALIGFIIERVAYKPGCMRPCPS